MAFSTWTALKTTILDALDDGSVLTKSYSIGDKQHSFRDLTEVLAMLKYIDTKIAAEAGGGVVHAKFVRAR